MRERFIALGYGILGALLAAVMLFVGLHLYADHLLVDAAREDSLRRMQQMQAPQAPPAKAETVPAPGK